jgi:anti-sigma factor RsiW
MNCNQVESLLPLYAGHDLDARTEGRISLHLQSCAACTAAAAEYRDTRQLLEDFAPPEFSEGTFAGMRQVVWRQIETESTAPSFSGLIGAWFRPRLGWAVVTAVLLVVFALGAYFMSDRRRGQQPVAVNPQKMDAGNGQPKQSALPAFTLAASRGNNNQRLSDQRPLRKRMQRTEVRDRTNRATMMAASAPPARLTTSTPNGSIPSGAAVNGDTQKTLRMEIQTKNPNIRIIWLAPRDAKSSSPNSRGI